MPIGSDFLARLLGASGGGGNTPSGMAPSFDAGSIAPAVALPASLANVAKIYKPGIGGAFQRAGDNIGNFIESPEGRAALLRSGAETMQHGIGAGIETGANYVTGRHDAAAKTAEEQAKDALTARGQDITRLSDQQRYDLGLIDATTNSDRLREDSRHNRAGESLTGRGQDVDVYRTDRSALTTERGQDIGLQSDRENRATTERGQDTTFRSNIYNANTDYLGKAVSAGIGSKSLPTMETKVETPAHTQGGFMGMGGTPVPKTTTTTMTPLAGPNAGVVSTGGEPTPDAVAALKANPGLKAEFERKYGPGSSVRYLGGM